MASTSPSPSRIVSKRINPRAAALAAGYSSYRAYLASPAWRQSPARLSALRFAAGYCRLCGNRRPLEVHHSSYERLGREKGRDLVAICRPCHGGVTDLIADKDGYEELILRVVV
jgi:5-methylcytosine-specific restriction endonuclease McrA